MTRSLRSLDGLTRIHIVGAGGSGMAPLAKLLTGMGHTMSGSDLKPGNRLHALADLGIDVWVGHRTEAVRDVDLVVASSAVPERDPELMEARRAQIPVWSRPELLEAVTTLLPAIGFTGTHGKTTSTALAVTALRALELDPTFIVGGELLDLNTGAHHGNPEIFLLEADEAFGTFRHLHLCALDVTNIEPDHLDYYESVAALEEAFALVANRTEGPVVGCIDDPGVRRLTGRAPVITYGLDPDATWRVTDVDDRADGVSFLLTGPSFSETIHVSLPGLHMARNAAGVIALLSELDFPAAEIGESFAGFGGVRRRFEVRARVAGVTVVDDYAHHPTEVAATIAAGRSGSWRRVFVVFQPHRYTRTADLAPMFGEPLALADEIVVTDVYPAGEPPLPGVTGRLVAEAVAAVGGVVEYVPALADVAPFLESRVAEGDLVLLLGAGDVNTIAEDLVAALESTS